MAQASLPPSKKQRLQHQHSAPKMTVEESELPPARLLYFDKLPAELISEIVRFLSKLPRAEKRASYMDLSDLFGLYSVKGQLGTYMLSLCPALRLEKKNSNMSLSSLKDEPTEAVSCRPQDLLDLSLPKSFTDSICTLEVRCEVSKLYFESLSAKLPNIRDLQIDPDTYSEDEWAEHYMPDLIDTFPTFPSTTAKCFPNLQRLYLFTLDRDESNEKAWKKAGENLESLYVTCSVETKDLIGCIKKFCRKLKSIEVSGVDDEVEEEIVNCIVSYGDQLQHVSLYMFNYDKISRVMAACPQARIELRTYDSLLSESLNIVGDKLEIVTVYPEGSFQEKQRAVFNWCACKDIKEAEFYFDTTVEDIQRFLKSPRHTLKRFLLCMDGDKKKVKAAISLIAKGTGLLEDFSIQCDDAAPGTFKELVRANSSLRKVRITLNNSSCENVVAADIVETFLISPELSKVVVTSGKKRSDQVIDEIKRICGLAECRSVWITVFGKVYLY